MRLFLASQDLGSFPEVLAELVGKKKRAFIISNARDYYQDEERINNALKKTFVNLEKIGIQCQRLDLRDYFDKSAKLVRDIESYDPGLIFSIGGNVYCLSTALHESGMDKIIKQGLIGDKFVYGGYSAGSMIALDDLRPYEVQKLSEENKFCNSPEYAGQSYDLSPYMFGLGIIDEYIIPHMDREDHIETMKQRIKNIEQIDATMILLNDADVYVANNDEHILMKGEK